MDGKIWPPLTLVYVFSKLSFSNPHWRLNDCTENSLKKCHKECLDFFLIYLLIPNNPWFRNLYLQCITPLAFFFINNPFKLITYWKEHSHFAMPKTRQYVGKYYFLFCYLSFIISNAVIILLQNNLVTWATDNIGGKRGLQLVYCRC